MSIILILSIAALFYHPKTSPAANGQYSVIPLSVGAQSTGTSLLEVQAPSSSGEDSPATTGTMSLAPKTWSDPWLNGFGYRKPISISYSGTALTDYQVNVTIDTAALISAGKMRSDCGDIRVTDSDGTTRLSYWLESGCNTPSTKFWVKVPSIPTTGTTIYAYYGNPQANDAQNGTGTFEFFDDFNIYDTSKWTSTGTPTTSGGIITVPYGIWLSSLNTFPINTAMTWHASMVSTAYGVVGYGQSAANNNAVFYANHVTANVINAQNHDGAAPSFANLGAWSGYHKYTVKRNGNTNAKYSIDYGTDTDLAGNLNTGLRNAVIYSQTQVITADWVYVRKYASPEPSATQGTEESLTTMSGGAQNWTWKVPSIGEKVRSGGAQDWNWKPFQQYLGRYRKPISISYSGTTLTQYQVNVTPYIYNETGLVGSWHFSNNATDSSGYGNTGTVYGASLTTDGKFGNAMRFDGTDDYVDAGNAASLQFNAIGQDQPFSVDAWIKPADTREPIIAKENFGGDRNWQLMLYDGTIYASMYNVDGLTYIQRTAPDNLVRGAWSHIAMTYSGSETPAGSKIYVNGTQVDTTSSTLGTYTGMTNGATVKIGVGPGSGSVYFNGAIDEVRIYNRALSPSEIQQQYNATKARLDYQDIRFTDATGTTLLPFWMESDGKFWVKVPSIPTTGTTIYAYYGNPSANDAQNGTGTFEFFDDFNTDLFTDVGTGFGVNTASSRLEYSNNRNTANDLSYKNITINSGDNFQVTFKINILTGAANSIVFFGISDTALQYDIYTVNGFGLWVQPQATPQFALTKIENGVITTSAKYTTSFNTVYTIVLIRNNTTIKLEVWNSDKSVLLQSYTDTITAVPYTNFKASDYDGDEAGGYVSTGWIDTPFISKYASSEPTAVNGTDEDSPIPQNITVPFGGATNWTWYPS